MQRIDELHGLKILVVEDDYMIATDIACQLEDSGAEVVGPAGTIEDALSLIEIHGDELDCAALDVNVRGERVYPVADALLALHVPVVLASGYDTRNLPPSYRSLPHCDKPVDSEALVRLIASSLRDSPR